MFAAIALLTSVSAQAAMLDAASWTLRDPAGQERAETKDNDAATGALLTSSGSVIRCTIDLGATTTIHRIYFAPAAIALDPGSTQAAFTAASAANFRVRVGAAPDATSPLVATGRYASLTGREFRVWASLRFQPTAGRFLVLELDRGALSNRWNLGEVELYGWPGDALAARGDAVVVSTNAPAPLRLAAEELRYYLGELAGRPVPTVAPAAAAAYTGTLFRIADLKSLAPDYATMTNNQALGLFPSTPVNIERSGREVTFRAWPYRNVLWSVWEFLDRQGVKWVYPDAHGDFVPAGRGVDLSVAPLQFTPSTDYIYANFGVEFLRPDPDAFLHFWRNGWTCTWGGHQRDAFDGTEVPAPPAAPYVAQADYAEGFDGYPHNFKNIVPERILAQHPEWCGMLTNALWSAWPGADALNKRLLPCVNHAAFDMTNPDLRRFIADKAVACWPDHARRNGSLLWLLPEDSTLFSEDAASVAQRGELRSDELPYAYPYLHDVSGDYYAFVCGIADALRTRLPQATVAAMAYSNTHRPPPASLVFPSNVLVEVCLYGARNLPMASPKNAELRARLEEWSGRVAQLRHYGYDLIHCESGALPMPVPMVTAFAERSRFYQAHRMLAGGSQADLATLPYNPWNYFAYPRFAWDVTRTADEVLGEFFAGYFLEAAAPMRAYYDTIERFMLANDVSVQGRGYDYDLVVGAFPVALLKRMDELLTQAEGRATYWITRQRLQPIRAGFQWILARRGLTIDQLAGLGAARQVGPGETLTLDLRTVSIQTAGQDVGDAWYLFSWAQVGEYVRFKQPGRYVVTIRAGIGWNDPDVGNRQMLFTIGATEYGPFRIDHASIDDYVLTVDVPAGVMEVAVRDLFNEGPFKAGTITIRGPDVAASAPAPAAVGGSVAHYFNYADAANPAAAVDSDWDGTPDLQESMAGTDALDPLSQLLAHRIAPAGDGLAVSWASVAGKRYALYRAAEVNGPYEPVAVDLEATPPENTYVDTAPDGGGVIYKIAAN